MNRDKMKSSFLLKEQQEPFVIMKGISSFCCFFFFSFCNLKTVAGGYKQSSSQVVNHCHLAFAVEDVFIQRQLSKSETQICS